MFIMVNLNVPTEKVGKVTSVSFSLGNLVATFCPLIVLLDQTLCYLIMCLLMVGSIVIVSLFIADSKVDNQLNTSRDDDDYKSLERGKWLDVVHEDIIEATDVNGFAREVAPEL